VLRRLRLEEFLLLPEVEVGFEPGLNAVTGETGTGKSILIDAIGFLVGGRADSTWIRSGSEALQVVGEFSIDRLPEAGAAAAAIGVAPSKDGGIEIRRELTLRGRSKAWVQGKSARVHELRLLGEQLLEIHAQGEHRRLLDPATQLALVDRMPPGSPPARRIACESGSSRDARAALGSKRSRRSPGCSSTRREAPPNGSNRRSTARAGCRKAGRSSAPLWTRRATRCATPGAAFPRRGRARPISTKRRTGCGRSGG
jgi:hypothetical protein